MRGIVLILIILSAFTFTLSAQGQSQRQDQEIIKPDRGIKGGLASARFRNALLETGPAPGFALGAFMDVEVNERFSVLTEVYYSEKGSKVYSSTVNSEFDLNLDYVEVPILLNYRVPTASRFTPRFFAGPYAAILINSSSSVSVDDDRVTTPDDFVEVATDGDWGGVAGAGVDADFAFRTMTLEVRYSAGLSRVFGRPVSRSYKNGVVSILIGFYL